MPHHRPWARQEETVCIVGSFDTAGDGTVAATTVRRGKGWTVARTGAGVYRITFTSDQTGRKYPTVLSAIANCLKAGDSFAHFKAFSAANGTADIEVVSAGVAADLASGEIHFAIWVRNTGLV